MSDISVGDKPSRTPWNKNDKRGLAISIALPVLAVLIGNAIIYALGWNESSRAYDAGPLSPPGWFVGAVWIVLYAMWGAARWYAYQTGLAGRRASYWVLLLMLWGLAYPIITAAGDSGVSALANVISLALALWTTSKLRPVSKRAFWLAVPPVLWIGFAAILGFAALSYA